jgi:hypothetical protein
LANVAGDEIGEVGVEEALATAGVRTSQCLGKAASHNTFGIILPGNRRFVSKRFALLEDSVNEPIRRTVDLPLGKRP